MPLFYSNKYDIFYGQITVLCHDKPLFEPTWGTGKEPAIFDPEEFGIAISCKNNTKVEIKIYDSSVKLPIQFTLASTGTFKVRNNLIEIADFTTDQIGKGAVKNGDYIVEIYKNHRDSTKADKIVVLLLR
jgi:hypothetical protein